MTFSAGTNIFLEILLSRAKKESCKKVIGNIALALYMRKLGGLVYLYIFM
jgi:hypothetical protein